MNQFYTAIGRTQIKGTAKEKRCPMVSCNNKEYILDLQEMILWSVLNWRIATLEEAKEVYTAKEKELQFHSDRSFEKCLQRLTQRELIAEGTGATAADALYTLLSELYIIPISENIFLRTLSFIIHLTFFSKVPFSVTKKVFCRDKRNNDEKKVIQLSRQAMLSTAEIIKCVELNKLDFSTEEDLLNTLYYDDYTTSENIAYTVRSLPQCRPVITSITNLYLRKQIIFERN